MGSAFVISVILATSTFRVPGALSTTLPSERRVTSEAPQTLPIRPSTGQRLFIALASFQLGDGDELLVQSSCTFSNGEYGRERAHANSFAWTYRSSRYTSAERASTVLSQPGHAITSNTYIQHIWQE